MILELPVGSQIYKVYAEGLFSLVFFKSITDYLYIPGMMFKVSRKEKPEKEKEKFNSKIA